MVLQTLLMLAAPTAALANGDHAEEAGVGAQLNELLPFEHLTEGHWVAFIVSVILWASLIYTLVNLVSRRSAKS